MPDHHNWPAHAAGVEHGSYVIGCVIHVEFGWLAPAGLAVPTQIEQYLPQLQLTQGINLKTELLGADIEPCLLYTSDAADE